jgi:hypothetical protein
VIYLSIEMLSGCQSVGIGHQIVTFLRPWFNNLRLVHTTNCIVQGIHGEFRRFTIPSDFGKMDSISRDFSDEFNNVFDELWSVLLREADNHRMAFLFSFESQPERAKGLLPSPLE